MVAYEAVLVLRPDLEEEESQAVITRFVRLVEEGGGEITKLETWGKRKLAYEVQKFREGYYVLLFLQAEPQVAREIERVARISDAVLRFLVIRQSAKAAS